MHVPLGRRLKRERLERLPGSLKIMFFIPWLISYVITGKELNVSEPQVLLTVRNKGRSECACVRTCVRTCVRACTQTGGGRSEIPE